jgi:hypothetical protein
MLMEMQYSQGAHGERPGYGRLLGHLPPAVFIGGY